MVKPGRSYVNSKTFQLMYSKTDSILTWLAYMDPDRLLPLVPLN